MYSPGYYKSNKDMHCPLKLWISLKELVLPWGHMKYVENRL